MELTTYLICRSWQFDLYPCVERERGDVDNGVVEVTEAVLGQLPLLAGGHHDTEVGVLVDPVVVQHGVPNVIITNCWPTRQYCYLPADVGRIPRHRHVVPPQPPVEVVILASPPVEAVGEPSASSSSMTI